MTYWNIIAIPLVPMVAMILSTYLNAQVIFLLASGLYNIQFDRIGEISGLLIFVSLPGAIIGTAFIGYVYDIMGRKFTLFTSFLIGSILICAVPWTAPNVLPWLLVIRLLI